ncbi:hypothetical protein DRN50_07020 [Thermococci archaeon]|nr:MAG: hypothetical protein DRN50_07020 [Thermococci archaeon]
MTGEKMKNQNATGNEAQPGLAGEPEINEEKFKKELLPKIEHYNKHHDPQYPEEDFFFEERKIEKEIDEFFKKYGCFPDSEDGHYYFKMGGKEHCVGYDDEGFLFICEVE